MFIRNENFDTFRKSYPVVTILLTIHILVFLLYKLSFFGVGHWIYNQGIGWNQMIAEGQWWRLITPIFLHANIPHVLFNSFTLFLFAPALEVMLGKSKFIIGYLGAGVIGNIATFYLQNNTYMYLGASGAIFGLFGFYLFLVLFRKELIGKDNSTIIITILVISLIMTFLQANIDILGHLFGLLGGLLLAPILFYNRRKNI